MKGIQVGGEGGGGRLKRKRKPTHEAPSRGERKKGKKMNKCQDKDRYGLITFLLMFLLRPIIFSNFRPKKKYIKGQGRSHERPATS